MTPREAAEVIGCTARHVRHLVQKGKLKATKCKTSSWPYYVYHISLPDAEEYRDTPQTKGFPRGFKR
jgi:hypothetical protein